MSCAAALAKGRRPSRRGAGNTGRPCQGTWARDLAHPLGGRHLGQQRLLVDDRLEQAVEGVGQLADLVVPLDGQRLPRAQAWRISSSRSAERSRGELPAHPPPGDEPANRVSATAQPAAAAASGGPPEGLAGRQHRLHQPALSCRSSPTTTALDPRELTATPSLHARRCSGRTAFTPAPARPASPGACRTRRHRPARPWRR